MSISHHQADVETIESVTHSDPRDEIRALLGHESVSEAFVLQTCNRAERYVVTEEPEQGRAILGERIESALDAADWLSHGGAMEHLMRVSAGLESMVVGEDQILGQLKSARTTAEGVDGVGPLLDEVLLKAMHVGERARSETHINDGVVSLGRAAVNLAARETTLSDATVTLIGAGPMARKAGMALVEADVRWIQIANRTHKHARQLATEFKGIADAVRFDQVSSAIAGSDAVISATGSTSPILSKSDFPQTGQVVAVDMAQPRDIRPGVDRLDSVALFNLDDIRHITEATSQRRACAAQRVEEMIDEELEHLKRQLKRKQADDVIAAMYEGAEAIKRRELSAARARLEGDDILSAHGQEILDEFADALVGHLMAAPTKALRDAAESDDWEKIQHALQLFDPAFQSGEAQMTPRSEKAWVHLAKDDAGDVSPQS